MNLIQLVYLSRSTRPINEQDLNSIRESAARNNPRRGLTGALLYVGGNFMQLLEGDANDVAAAFAKIQQDLRHKECRVLFQAHMSQRLFPIWSMNVVRVRDWSMEERKQFLDIILDSESPGRLHMDRVFELFRSLNAGATALRL